MSKQVNINLSLMTPIFIGLVIAKLGGFLNISWWLVTLPLWLPLVLFLGMLGVGFLFFFVKELLKSK